TSYVNDVLRWGLIYATSSPASSFLGNALRRTLDWAGFHFALVVAAACGLRRKWRLLAWIALCFAAVCVGGRFVPRYFLQLLPPLVILAAQGITLAWRRCGKIALLLLAIPFIRF